MPEIDVFYIFRNLVFVFVTVYTVVAMAASIRRTWTFLSGEDPAKRLARRYLAYQLVSVRFRPFAGELLQIGAWGVALVVIYWMHTWP